jgi:HlyD family secretion protein
MNSRFITGPRLIGGLILLAIAAAIFFSVREKPVPVEVARVTRGALAITVDDEGETRVANLYIVSAPVSGQLLRVPLKPGDKVVAGRTVVARLQPAAPEPLSSRRYAEMQATIRSLEAQYASAGARVREANAGQVLAAQEYARVDQLAQAGFVSKASLDRARAARDQADALVAEAGEAAKAARHGLDAARAQLVTAQSGGRGLGAVAVTSPVAGVVMRVPQESERVVLAGTPLVEIGDPDQLEVVTDLDSADAVRVKLAAPVLIDAWGGGRPLMGKVRLIEPYGFTKISALGVEEQRVNVIITFAEPRKAWERLGHGYRVVVRITISSVKNVVQIPISALFRAGNRWSAFVVGGDGKARLVYLDIGDMSDDMAEVRKGIEPGTRVILHPGDQVKNGRKVEERTY